AIGVRPQATVAMLLFLAYATTRFLAGWASGFQDLLALALSLVAVRAQLAGRTPVAGVWAVLATFAKESAALVFPLLAAETLLFQDRPQQWRAWRIQSGGLVTAGLLHAAVRLTWHGGGRPLVVERSLSRLAAALGRVLTGFLPAGGSP